MTEGTKNTDEIKAKVKTLYLDGVSASLIAQALWVDLSVRKSRNAVIGIIHRMGLTGQRPNSRPSIAKHNPGTAGKKLGARRRREPWEVQRPNFGEPGAALVLALPPRPAQRPIEGMPPRNIPLFDLRTDDCRFIVAQSPARYCARPAAFGTPYCATCAAVVYSAEGLENLKRPRAPSLRRVA